MDLVASHQRLLVGVALRTEGSILELGCGNYSTPILHEIAVTQKRLVRTIDNNPHWLNQFKGYDSEYHIIELIGWWGDLDVANHQYGMVFVDNGQPCEREYAIRRLLEQAEVDVFVMHDTEELFAYGYNRVLPMFKYTWQDKWQKAYTTVASNTMRVDQWFKKLPPCEPSTDVT